MRAYAPDSPNWEDRFALEHEEEHRRSIHIDPPAPLLLEVLPEEEEAEAEYQAALEEALKHALEASRLE